MAITTAETPVKVYKRVDIDPESHELLKQLAEKEHRTLGGEVQYLIEKAAEEHGIATQSTEKPESES